MATGGGGCSDDEEMYSFELFNCSVCLESLMNKHPRLLSCGHTFCTPCLQQVSRWNGLSCPKCRRRIVLPPGGVTALPKNTDLGKMKDREQELSARNENACQMCKKKGAKAEYICTSCTRRLICQACYDLHTKVPAMKWHTVLLIEANTGTSQYMCEVHDDVLAYFCSQCVQTLCAECICESQHLEHTEQIIDRKSGLEGVNKDIHEMKQQLKEYETKINKGVGIVGKEMTSLTATKTRLSNKCRELENILHQMRQQLDKVIKLEVPLSKYQIDITKHSKDIEQQIREIQKSGDLPEKQLLLQSKQWRENFDNLNNVTHGLLETHVTLPKDVATQGNIVDLIQITTTRDVYMKETIEVQRKDNIEESNERT